MSGVMAWGLTVNVVEWNTDAESGDDIRAEGYEDINLKKWLDVEAMGDYTIITRPDSGVMKEGRVVITFTNLDSAFRFKMNFDEAIQVN